MRQTKIARIQERMMADFLGSKLIDNNLRGYWCAVMLAKEIPSDSK